MRCERCNTDMQKKAVLESGNSRFQQYRCDGCYTEKSQAIGLIDMSLLK